jgi:signal transduction histidine kinase
VNTKGLATALRGAYATLQGAATGKEERSAISAILAAIQSAESRLGEPVVLDPVQTSLEGRIIELERALQGHEEFLSTVGHELRNPLSPLCMQVEYLRDTARVAQGGLVDTGWLVPQLDRFSRRLRKFIDLLNRIMDVSRLSAGRVVLELEPVDLADVTRDVCAAWERELALAKCELTLDIADAVVGTWDRVRVEQVVSNLLSNAIRYGAGKPIHVSVRATSSHAYLAVRDHGVGIAAQDRERIFRRFERVSSQRQAGGFGIGLWIVQQSCVAMEGSIEVQSELGKGSEFAVKLPYRLGQAGELRAPDHERGKEETSSG